MAASESGRIEQIISQFLLKVLHIVLDSRIPHLGGGGNNPSPQHVRVGGGGGDLARKRDRWFNLALGDPPAALESLGFWHRSIADPMVIDVILFCCVGGAGPEEEAIVERWTVHYEPSSSSPSSSSPSPLRAVPQSTEASASFYKRTYKKSILLLRSLYSTLRLLPAYKAFRVLSSTSNPNSGNQSYNYNLSYKVSSFAEPFSRAEEEEMKHYNFTPVETQFGHLAVSVAYRPDLSDFNLEASSLLPPRIISDYVGSPAADPMRAFPSSLPSCNKGAHPISFPLRGVVRSGSSAVPLSRPHSWTSAPLAHHPLSTSPSNASESQTSPADGYGQCAGGSYRLTAHKKGSISFDDYRLSPPFSPSPTPSPPTHCGNPLQSRLQSETAPVSIPVPAMGKNLVHHRTPNFSDPTRNLLPPPSPRSTRVDLSSQETPLESRSFRKLEGLRGGEFYPNLPGYTIQKGFRDSRDDSGRFSGVLSAGGSPRLGFSRSSSRLSLQDDLDDSEFCPFAVDDVDTLDSQTRNLDGKEASEAAQIFTPPRKSQDAAVGVLVHMLRTAPPLRQDPSYSSQSSKPGFDGEGNSSSFFVSRKATDALEELQSYKEMKDVLLSQSKSQLLGSVKQISK